jgi:protein-L-isoaspartate(D-aspartate) O-methyltransferase
MSEAAVAMVRQYAEQGQSAAELRRTMVDRQLRPFDVTDVPLLERFLNVPRELFLPAGQETLAYSDRRAASRARRRTFSVTPRTF